MRAECESYAQITTEIWTDLDFRIKRLISDNDGRREQLGVSMPTYSALYSFDDLLLLKILTVICSYGPPYAWEGDEPAKQARIEKYKTIDMTSDIMMFCNDLHELDDGKMLPHARVLVETIRNNASTPKGKVAIAMVEAAWLEANDIAAFCEELLPKETVEYFRTPRDNYWELKAPMMQIFLPYMFDEDELYDFDEMEALGIPTYHEFLQEDYAEEVKKSKEGYEFFKAFNKL